MQDSLPVTLTAASRRGHISGKKLKHFSIATQRRTQHTLVLMYPGILKLLFLFKVIPSIFCQFLLKELRLIIVQAVKRQTGLTSSAVAICHLIGNFLRHRKQYVRLASHMSSPLTVGTGTPSSLYQPVHFRFCTAESLYQNPPNTSPKHTGTKGTRTTRHKNIFFPRAAAAITDLYTPSTLCIVIYPIFLRFIVLLWFTFHL